MSRTLLKKVLRDLAERRLALLALVLIVAVGVGSYAAMTALHRDIDGTRAAWYADRRLADFAVNLERAPAWVVGEVRRLPEVREARGRIDFGVRVLLGDDAHPISGQALSLPVPRRPVLNDVLLRSGTWFTGPDAHEVLLNEAFARENGIGPGDHVRVLFLDREYELLVVGTAMSPEFVYLIPPSGGVAPDPARFGAMYLPERFLREACSLSGAFDQIVGRVHDPADRPRLLATLDQLEEHLDPWGVTSTVPWFDQPSIRFLADEIEGLEVSARVLPLVFLIVAALVLNVLMSRLVAQQRTVIGTLKALGHGNVSLSAHFACYGVAVGLAGGLVGALVGYGLQSWLIDVYREIYPMPGLTTRPHLDVYAGGVAFSVAFALLGTLKGLHAVRALAPAEAMRPPPPEQGGRVLPERVAPLWRRLSFASKMALRTVFRSPFRSAVAVIGSAVATALILASLGIWDSLWYLMEHEFERLAHEDVTVALRDPEDLAAVEELARLDGVTFVEPQLSVACDLRSGSREKRVAVVGLPPGSRLHTPLDAAGRPLAIPDEGLVLTRKLAELLDVRAGDQVRFRPLIGRRTEVRAPVVGVIDTYLGLVAYADLRHLARLVGEHEVANGLLATTATGGPTAGLLAELDRRPTVLGLSERERALSQIDATFGEAQGTAIRALVLFAGLIAFGSVINSALVSIGERRREIGTFRVLGFSAVGVWRIFATESLVLNGVGVALGLAGGRGLAHLLALAYSTELYRFPAVVTGERMVQSVLLMAFFVGVAQLIVLRMIARLPWLEVLNVRE